jgi:hypothetical protein
MTLSLMLAWELAMRFKQQDQSDQLDDWIHQRLMNLWSMWFHASRLYSTARSTTDPFPKKKTLWTCTIE